jgi:hypothetical protein
MHTDSRGPMEHQWDHERHGLTIPGLRDDDAVALPLRAGDIALFWSITPHSTQANRTTDVRKGYIVQLAPDGWDNQLWERGESECPKGRAGVPKVGRPMVRAPACMYLLPLPAHATTALSHSFIYHRLRVEYYRTDTVTIDTFVGTGSQETYVEREPCHTVCHHARRAASDSGDSTNGGLGCCAAVIKRPGSFLRAFLRRRLLRVGVGLHIARVRSWM